MNKDKARKSLALAASKKGYTLQVKAGKDADQIRILNSSKEVVAYGTLALDASGYAISDVAKTVSQIRGQLPNALNSARRRKMNAAKNDYSYDLADELTRWAQSILDSVVESAPEYKTSDASDLEKGLNYSGDEAIVALSNADPGKGSITIYFRANHKGGYSESSKLSAWADAQVVPSFSSIEGVSLVSVEGAYYGLSGRIVIEFTCDQPTTKIIGHCYPTTVEPNIGIKASRSKTTNASCHSKRTKMNAADDDVEVDETLMQDDAEFVDDVESIVTDEKGNEIVVDEMLVVQNPDTNEISLFVPTEEDDQVPEDVEVIGEVTAADDETVLDSSRRMVKMKASRRK